MSTLVRVYEDDATPNTGERIAEAMRGSKYQIEGNKIKGVHLLGMQSKNVKKGQKDPFSYDETATKEAATLYNNIDIVVGHTPDNISYGQRDPSDKIGFTENACFKESKGLFGDIVLNEKHPMFEQFMWWAKNKPEKLMLSHEAWCNYDDKTNKMTKINAVDCIAFVTVGGTTEGLFKEGVITDTITQEDEERKLERLLRTFIEISYEKRWPLGKTLTQEQQAVEIAPVIQDLLTEVNKLLPKTQTEAATTAADSLHKESKKEHTMEFADITLETLTKNRKDLVEVIALDAVDKHVAIETAVAEALAKVPVEVHSDIFKAQVRAAVEKGDTKLVESLVADRKELVGKVTTQTESALPPAQARGKKQPEKEASKADVLALAKKRD
jgi:hypothetical protein